MRGEGSGCCGVLGASVRGYQSAFHISMSACRTEGSGAGWRGGNGGLRDSSTGTLGSAPWLHNVCCQLLFSGILGMLGLFFLVKRRNYFLEKKKKKTLTFLFLLL